MFREFFCVEVVMGVMRERWSPQPSRTRRQRRACSGLERLQDGGSSSRVILAFVRLIGAFLPGPFRKESCR